MPTSFFAPLRRTTAVNPWLAGAALRIALVAYSALHDLYITPPFTDIDYHVALSGAQQLAAGKSPFDAATYRYSPALAYIMLPSLMVHQSIGKVIFSAADLACAAVIDAVAARIGVKAGEQQWIHAAWLLNPMIAVLSARGSSDALLVALPVLVLLYLMVVGSKSSISSLALIGCIHGLAIHLKIVPVIFAPSVVMHIWNGASSFRAFVVQSAFYGLAMLTTLASITYCCYSL